MRHVILHYHYFKNAGSSVDSILQKNFGQAWVTAEFPDGHSPELVANWIRENPSAIAFSSHTANLPLPVIEGVTVHPVVFLRHPVDRIRSVYAFERHQPEDSLGTRIARNTDFKGYIEARLAIEGDRQLRDFQCNRLARFAGKGNRPELDRALDAVSRLPFIGVVENFDASMKRLENLLRPYFPEFHAFAAWENATAAKDTDLAGRLDAMRDEIGESLWQHLQEANRADLELYRSALLLLTEPTTPRIKPVKQLLCWASLIMGSISIGQLSDVLQL
jgi:hypothetical protein